MITILSPSKTLNFKTPNPIEEWSDPVFCDRANNLIDQLRKLTSAEIMNLMNISNGIGGLNFLRYAKWEPQHTSSNSKPAIFAYIGEVYSGFEAANLDKNQAEFAQTHLRIISGLYGILRPLDKIQPYRLEMRTKLKLENHKNLYDFWTETITGQINKELEQHQNKTLINLASKEYSKSIDMSHIKGIVINPLFKEMKNNKLKNVTVYTEKARGLMARFIINNKIDTLEDLKLFNSDGYIFNEMESDSQYLLFTR